MFENKIVKQCFSPLGPPLIASPLIKNSHRKGNWHRKGQNYNHLCNSTLTTNMDKQYSKMTREVDPAVGKWQRYETADILI